MIITEDNSVGTDVQVVLEKFGSKQPFLTDDLKWPCLFWLVGWFFKQEHVSH